MHDLWQTEQTNSYGQCDIHLFAIRYLQLVVFINLAQKKPIVSQSADDFLSVSIRLGSKRQTFCSCSSESPLPLNPIPPNLGSCKYKIQAI